MSSFRLPSQANDDDEALSDNHRYYFGPSRLLRKRIRVKSSDGTLDFTITGGNAPHPIHVASVVWASSAYSQGMRPGDEILSVNSIPFDEHVNYTKALQVRCFGFQTSRDEEIAFRFSIRPLNWT